MKKHHVIVGAGIVGIVAAFLSISRGNKVTLIDSSSKPGGLLKSDVNKYGAFDYGTHVASETGIKELDDFLFSGVTEDEYYFFNQGESGSFINGTLSESSPFLNVNSIEGESVAKALQGLILKSKKLGENNNLEQLLVDKYGKELYLISFLPFILKTFNCHPSNLPSNYIYFFDMYRVIAFDEETTIELKKIDYLNDKLGFHSSSIGVKKYYPKCNGIGYWTNSLIQKLITMGVDIIINENISSISKLNTKYSVELQNRKDKLISDKLIWTISSALLTRFLSINSNLTKPYFRKTGLYDFVFSKPLDTKNYYINNFDSNYYSTRLTCYQNLSINSNYFAVTVEVLADDDVNLDSLIDIIFKEIQSMGLVDTDNICLMQQYRPINEGFPVITLELMQQLDEVNNFIEQEHSNLILLGRSSNKGFFMSELLNHTYKLLA